MTGNDRTLMKVLTSVHKQVWKGVENEMRDWLEESWETLHQTRPDWFTDDVVRKIPLEFVPNIAHTRAEMNEKDLADLERKQQGRGSLRASLRATLGITSTSGSAHRSEEVARQTANEVVAEMNDN